MIKIYTQVSLGKAWLQRYQGCCPHFVCLLGFTATGLIPGISAAGATPQDRQYTAIADAEFLMNGYLPNPTYPLPPLTVGVSPVLITRAVVDRLQIPVHLFNTGLAIAPTVPSIDLGGLAANCLSTGQSLPLATVEYLFEQGLMWGQQLAQNCPESYLILSECVVGGTTTALAVLTALGIDALGKVNSSHPQCNHQQKWDIVQQGLQKAQDLSDPFNIVAAVGDPMQIVCAGMAIAASQTVGVILAGGTQMLAVYALIQAILTIRKIPVNLSEIVVGTTRWVAEDPTGDTVSLAALLAPVCLMATQLNFSHSRYPQLQIYEEGFVKEGVGAGAAAIAAHLYQNWDNDTLVKQIENLLDTSHKINS
jgi:uncharacterized protein (TIGR00303 family)